MKIVSLARGNTYIEAARPGPVAEIGEVDPGRARNIA
jgi:hypothetical protein